MPPCPRSKTRKSIPGKALAAAAHGIVHWASPVQLQSGVSMWPMSWVVDCCGVAMAPVSALLIDGQWDASKAAAVAGSGIEIAKTTMKIVRNSPISA